MRQKKHAKNIYAVLFTAISILIVPVQVMASGSCEYIYPDGSVCGRPTTTYDSLCNTHYAELFNIYSDVVSDYNTAVDEFYANGGDLSTLDSTYSSGSSSYSSGGSAYSSSSEPSSKKRTYSSSDNDEEALDIAEEVYKGETYNESESMAKADKAVDGISQEEQLEIKDTVVYAYKIGANQTEANNLFKEYQSVLSNNCGLTLQGNMDGTVNVYNDDNFISYICTTQDKNQYRMYIVFVKESGDAKDIDFLDIIAGASVELQLAADYKNGVNLMNSGYYERAIAAFEKLGDYKDCEEKINACYYKTGWDSFLNRDFKNAYDYYSLLGDYEDASEMSTVCKDLIQADSYRQAQEKFLTEEYEEAKKMFADLGGYANSEKMVQECDYRIALQFYHGGDVGSATKILEEMSDFKDSGFYLKLIKEDEELVLLEDVQSEKEEEKKSLDDIIKETEKELKKKHEGYFAVSYDEECITINLWDNTLDDEMQRIAVEKYNEAASINMNLRVNLLNPNDFNVVNQQYYNGINTIKDGRPVS